MVPQTCFCCVLEAQQVESSALLQQHRRDELAAEMLKVLTRPFMVRCFLLFFPIWLCFLCSFSSRSILFRPRLLCFSFAIPLLCKIFNFQAGLDDQNHSAKTCARMLKGCFRSSFPYILFDFSPSQTRFSGLHCSALLHFETNFSLSLPPKTQGALQSLIMSLSR